MMADEGSSNHADVYGSLLERYFRTEDEHCLTEAAELGHRMLQDHVPPEDIVEIHQTAILRLLESPENAPLREWVERTSIPLTELLMAYSLAFRKEADERLERITLLRLHEAALEAAANAIVITDRDGSIEWVNPAFTRMTGYRPEEAFGNTPRILKSGRHPRAFYERLWKTILGGRTWRGEIVNRSKRGSLYVEDVVITPVVDDHNEITHFVGILQDVSERDRAARDLKAAEAGITARNEFLARMSHELRTPLNVVLGFAQVLELEDLNPEQESIVRNILKAGSHLLDLINEVLDLSRIEAGRISLSPGPLVIADVLEEAVDLSGPLARRNGVSVELQIHDTGAIVTADRHRMGQVMLNLLSNAIKYNRRGGQVTVKTEPAPDGGQRVTVSDTGRGIPAAEMEHLFEPFERLGAEGDPGTEGTGLGLAITRGLVVAMGGEIGAASEEGVGSSFWVDLPGGVLADPGTPRREAERAATPVEGPAALSSRVVLFIEDNLANVGLVETLVKRRPKTELLTAMQGRLGISLARDHQPDLIILDLHLPDMDGEAVLAELRADPATRHIPVVVASADATETTVTRLLAAGARRFLTKPFDVREFLRIINDTGESSEESAGEDPQD